jgi:hypothetical protein
MRAFPTTFLVRSSLVGWGMTAALLLSGCAATQNTLAQDLAYERWEKCKDISGISLQRIESNGRIWITYSPDHTSAVARWRECDSAAQTAQGNRRVASNPAATATAAASSTLASQVHGPVLKPGSEWAYRWESPQGKGTFVWVLDREEVRDGAAFYVVRSGNREIYWRKSDLAYFMDVVNGEVEVRHAPPEEVLKWPLEVGRHWTQTFTREQPKDRQTSELQVACTILARESVTVPAGTFDTFKTSCWSTRTGQVRFEMWYAPQVGSFVRQLSRFTYGIRERELIEYRLR